MKYTLYYHDRAIDPISVLGQIYAPDTTGGVNIASVFFSDYNYSEAANSSTKTNVLSDHLIWEQPSIYDWDYDVVHERAGFSNTLCVDLFSGHSYRVEYVGKGGRADHVSNKHGRPNTNKIAGGGGAGGFTFTVRVNGNGYKLCTYSGGVQLRNASGTNIITGSADNGRNASGKSPGTGGCASVTCNTADSNIALVSSSAHRGGNGGSATIKHSHGTGSVSGGSAGLSVSRCFKMPKGAFTAFIDKITKFWTACLAVNNTKKPTSKSTVSVKNYNNTLAEQAKIFESFKAFCHGFNKIKIPTSSGTHKYLKWNYLSDADDTHINSLGYLNIKSDTVTIEWKDAPGGSKQTKKVTIWLKDSTNKTYSSKLRPEIYSNTKYKKKISWNLNEVMTSPSDILITKNGSGGGYGKGQGFSSSGWNDSNPDSSYGTNYVRVTILD